MSDPPWAQRCATRSLTYENYSALITIVCNNDQLPPRAEGKLESVKMVESTVLAEFLESWGLEEILEGKS